MAAIDPKQSLPSNAYADGDGEHPESEHAHVGQDYAHGDGYVLLPLKQGHHGYDYDVHRGCAHVHAPSLNEHENADDAR